jgi:hypothetical protein
VDTTTAAQRSDNYGMAGPLAAAGALIAGAISNFGNLSNHGNEDGGLGPFLIGAAVVLVVAAFVYLRVVPRAKGSTRTALVLAGLSVVTLVAYWAGLPIVFAPAAIVVGLSGRRSAGSTIAIVVASAALVVSAFAALFG